MGATRWPGEVPKRRRAVAFPPIDNQAVDRLWPCVNSWPQETSFCPRILYVENGQQGYGSYILKARKLCLKNIQKKLAEHTTQTKIRSGRSVWARDTSRPLIPCPAAFLALSFCGQSPKKETLWSLPHQGLCSTSNVCVPLPSWVTT